MCLKALFFELGQPGHHTLHHAYHLFRRKQLLGGETGFEEGSQPGASLVDEDRGFQTVDLCIYKRSFLDSLNVFGLKLMLGPVDS